MTARESFAGKTDEELTDLAESIIGELKLRHANRALVDMARRPGQLLDLPDDDLPPVEP